MTSAVDQRRRARPAPLQGPFTAEQEAYLRKTVRSEIAADHERCERAKASSAASARWAREEIYGEPEEDDGVLDPVIDALEFMIDRGVPDDHRRSLLAAAYPWARDRLDEAERILAADRLVDVAREAPSQADPPSVLGHQHG